MRSCFILSIYYYTIFLIFCLETGAVNAAELPDPEAIFQKYFAKQELNGEACKELSTYYLHWQKQYKLKNKLQLAKKIPILNTNAHHEAPYLWAQVQQKQKTNYRLLHLDSHSDLGYAPSSVEKKDQLKQKLTMVSQVLVPAAIANIITQADMCMPSWYKRTKLDGTKKIIGLARFPRTLFFRAKEDRIYPVVRNGHPFLKSVFPLVKGLSEKDYRILVKKEMNLHYFPCHQSFHQRIGQESYILGIDLDIFSTNGSDNLHIEDGHARPISPFRKGGQISSKEFAAVKQRLAHILEEFRLLAKKSWRPRIISLSDSSTIGADKNWNNFTPNCLAFLLNYKLNTELAKIFIED